MRAKNLHIIPIPAFEDNYIWLLHNKCDAVVVDPGDATPVLAALKKHALNLTAILITHHHSDHIDGVEEILKQYVVPVYAPTYERYPFEHTALSDGDQFHLSEIDLSFDVLWLPGHTLGHIAYVNDLNLFCGDVLFGAGCGRLFEGTPEQMLASLNRLKKLSPDTNVFCTHEYTTKNINFALTLEPDNQALRDRKHVVAQLRKNNEASLPTTIALELKTNPFLRCNQKTIIENSQADRHDELSVFSRIRTKRNHY